MQDGRVIANFILDYCDGKGLQITNISIQKIIYFCHAWFLVKTGTPLVKQKFEAWTYGPVLPYLYKEFSSFGDNPVKGRAHKIDQFNGKSIIAKAEILNKEILIDAINFYGRLSAWQLVELSHIEDGPWDKVWRAGEKINPGMQIENDEIREFYAAGQNLYKT